MARSSPKALNKGMPCGNYALAIEMESHGFLQATYRHSGMQALIVRGVSDLIDKKSEDDKQGSQQVAARHASAFAFEILAKLDIQPQ